MSYEARVAGVGREPRVGRRLALLPLVAWLSGCFVYQPVVTTPAAGTRMAFDLTDPGRVALRSIIGPEIARVEGALVHNSDTTYEVRVLETRSLLGVTNRWGGETVTLRREYVAATRVRRLSRGRTAVAVLGGAAGILAFILTRDLLGLGGRDPSDPPGGNGNEQ